jgi:hypothetical protein
MTMVGNPPRAWLPGGVKSQLVTGVPSGRTWEIACGSATSIGPRYALIVAIGIGMPFARTVTSCSTPAGSRRRATTAPASALAVTGPRPGGSATRMGRVVPASSRTSVWFGRLRQPTTG